MTTSPTSLPPLLTDDDVHERVASLIGRAARDRCVWLLLVDGDRRQTPVLMPMEDAPRRPERELLGGLTHVLGGLTDTLATDEGPGSVVLERSGPGTTTALDTSWGEALAEVCDDAGLGLLGVFASTRDGVHRVR